MKLEPSIDLVYSRILFAFYEYSFHEKLTKNMGPHCTVRVKVLAMAFIVALTLEPIKIYVQYLQCGESSCMMVSLSHLQRLCHWIFRMVLEYSYLWMCTLQHFGRKIYEKVFGFSLVHHVKGLPLQTLLVFQTIS